MWHETQDVFLKSGRVDSRKEKQDFDVRSAQKNKKNGHECPDVKNSFLIKFILSDRQISERKTGMKFCVKGEAAGKREGLKEVNFYGCGEQGTTAERAICRRYRQVLWM